MSRTRTRRPLPQNAVSRVAHFTSTFRRTQAQRDWQEPPTVETWTVEISIDVDRLIKQLSYRAITSKARRSTTSAGAIVLRALHQVRADPGVSPDPDDMPPQPFTCAKCGNTYTGLPGRCPHCAGQAHAAAADAYIASTAKPQS